MLLITGAMGRLGTIVITELLKNIDPSEIAIYTREEKKAQKWKDSGLTVRVGDFSDHDNLKRAYQGIDRLLLIPIATPNAFSEHKNVIDTAVEHGVRHLWFAGQAFNHHIEDSKLGSVGNSYILTEDYIKKSGLEYTIFQNGLYADTIPLFIGQQLPINGINFPGGHGRSSFVTREDVGEAMAKIMLQKNKGNLTYMLSGAESYSFIDIANFLSDLSGHEIPFINTDQEFFETTLQRNGKEEDGISFRSIYAKAIENGEFEVCDGTIEKVLARKPTSLEEYLKDTYLP
ncbi:MAG: SDR family NAD(P)-dependent oxidoreductase [Pedobacter sp.]|nr:MAG: SDR family NAD(P)-dependent oxidoreductase [Pedobacter sp.]